MTDEAQQKILAILHHIVDSSSSSPRDDHIVQRLLQVSGFPHAVVVAGICYPQGSGRPISVQSAAQQIIDVMEKGA